MGTILRVICRDCGHQDEQVDGPIMSGFLPRCDRCGTSRFVSISELEESDPPGIEPASPEVWELRMRRMPILAGPCQCGGHFSETAPIRCLACHSRSVSKTVSGMAD